MESGQQRRCLSESTHVDIDSGSAFGALVQIVMATHETALGMNSVSSFQFT